VIFGFSGEAQVKQVVHALVTLEKLKVLGTNVSNLNFSCGSMITNYLVVFWQAF
jgi:hypothetical protein